MIILTITAFIDVKFEKDRVLFDRTVKLQKDARERITPEVDMDAAS